MKTIAILWLAAGTLCTLAPAGEAAAAIRNVSTVSQLNTAVNTANPGDEIVLAAGTYNLTANLWMDVADVILRGATGDRGDVTLYGGGINNVNAIREAIQLAADDIEVRDLTVSGFFHHGIHFQPGTDRAVIDNVHTLNIGSHHVKGAKFNDDGVIRHSLLEQTEVRLNLPGRTDNYGGGIDLHGARRWHIHDNVAVGIHPISGGDAGIFLWNESTDALIERNVIVGCKKGIALGNPSNPADVVHMDRAIVRNNFITRLDDIGLELCYVKNVQAYNNTIYGDSGTYFRSVQLLDDYNGHYVPMENVELAYNIIRGYIRDNTRAGGYTLTGNIIGPTATSDWFVDAAAGELHLTEAASAAIDGAQALAEVFEDIDGGPRPAGALPDVGADEYASPLGDANYDGRVDLLDLTILAGNWEQAGNWGEGDFNQSGDVNLLDLTLLANNWGFPGGAGRAVPEPFGAASLVLGAAALLRRRPGRLGR